LSTYNKSQTSGVRNKNQDFSKELDQIRRLLSKYYIQLKMEHTVTIKKGTFCFADA